MRTTGSVRYCFIDSETTLENTIGPAKMFPEQQDHQKIVRKPEIKHPEQRVGAATDRRSRLQKPSLEDKKPKSRSDGDLLKNEEINR